MESAGIEPEWHDGLRVTTPKVLAAATKVFGEVGTELADALEAKGVRTAGSPTASSTPPPPKPRARFGR